MGTVYIPCGLPGSGKTTLSRYLAEQYSASLYIYDELDRANDPDLEKAVSVMKRMYCDVVEELRYDKNVVCDTLLITREKREYFLRYLDGIECKKICIVMTTSLEECLHRNTNREARLPDFVITQSAEIYEPPTMDEGWDEILYCYET